MRNNQLILSDEVTNNTIEWKKKKTIYIIYYRHKLTIIYPTFRNDKIYRQRSKTNETKHPAFKTNVKDTEQSLRKKYNEKQEEKTITQSLTNRYNKITTRKVKVHETILIKTMK